MTRATRALLVVAGAIVAASLLATLAWGALTLTARPLDGVEGDVLFEAMRIRAHLPLYVDPTVGAREYGEVPARYFVLYPPLWSAFLSLVPEGAAPLVARLVSACAWLGTLAFIVLRAPRRLPAAALAAFAAGAWVLSFYGLSGRPDAVAVALAGVALLRSVQHARVDVVAGALFALAAWVKPNVVGAFPGAVLGTALAAYATGGIRRAVRAVVPAITGAAIITLLVAGTLSVLTGKAWLVHLLASTGQAPSAALWAEQIASRAPFFALPLLGVLALGVSTVRTRREPAPWIATCALATSLAWCVLSLAKIGSAANYFLEPIVAAVVLVGHVARLELRSVVVAAFLVVQAAWTGVASVRSSLEHIPLASERRDLLRDVRALCGASEGALVLADEPGLELALNRRIVATPFQSTHLARRGAFPLDRWLADVRHPSVACLVMQDDLLERPLTESSLEHDRFGPELREALRERFVLVTSRAGFHVYRAR